MKKFFNSIFSIFSGKKKDKPSQSKAPQKSAPATSTQTSKPEAKIEVVADPIKEKAVSVQTPPTPNPVVEPVSEVKPLPKVELIPDVKPEPEVISDPIPKVVAPEPAVSEEISSFPIQDMLAYASEQVGTPYLIGGTTADAFDCSGFVGYVFQAFNINLPRTSSSQAETGQDIELSKVKKGDLVFFSHSGDRIQHVGIITSDEGNPLTMIHASTSKGVIHSDLENSAYWKPRIKWAKRVITDAVA